MCSLLLVVAAAHLGLTSLYILPFPIPLRDRLYRGTFFHQGWPLFSSFYPQKADMGFSAACLRGDEPSARERVLEDVMTPVWLEAEHSLLSPERFTRSRVASGFYLPYFRYARLQAEKRQAPSYSEFFVWLERRPELDNLVQVLTAITQRHCGKTYTHAELQVWACPRRLWQKPDDPPQTCTTHTLGLREL